MVPPPPTNKSSIKNTIERGLDRGCAGQGDGYRPIGLSIFTSQALKLPLYIYSYTVVLFGPGKATMRPIKLYSNNMTPMQQAQSYYIYATFNMDCLRSWDFWI